jgi:hypothetical protein
MNDQIQTTMTTLATGAIQCCAIVLDSLTPEQQERVGGALQAGARLCIEITPIPAFERATLILVEHEGTRHTLGSLEVGRAPISTH